jgi:predicted nuclease of predicted toxin-antitoxin system
LHSWKLLKRRLLIWLHSVKILLDECIDRRLAEQLSGHEVKTLPKMGWAGIKDGELLRLAEGEFDVLITVDRNLPFQQNLAVLDLVVLVLQARSNRLADLQVLVPEILAIVDTAPKATATVVRE